MTFLATLSSAAGRCAQGFDLATQHGTGGFCRCSDPAPVAPDGGGITAAEWSLFVAAVKAVVRPDGEVHQSDMRPRIRGRIEPKAIGRCYRRAKAERLLVDTQRREESDDRAGRNTDKLDRIYALGVAA